MNFNVREHLRFERVFILFLISIFCFNLRAAEMETYHFKYNFEGQTYHFKQTGTSYEQALEQAADSCFKHYKAGRRLTEERGLDIIDVCANPRS